MSARLVPALLLLAASANPVQARDLVLRLPVADALADAQTHAIVGTLALRFGSASASNADLVARDVQVDGVAEPLRENQNQRDSKAPSDESVCQKAFTDAMRRLSAAARQAGAVAAVGLVSDYKGQLADDTATYECHAGTFHSYVSLRAQFARALPHTLPLPAKSGYAELANVDAVPSTPAGKDRYAHFLTLPKPRAFAFLEDGTWRFWADDPDAIAKVFADCERLGKRCWLYAVDDRVVWNADERLRIGSVAQLTAPLAPKDEHE